MLQRRIEAVNKVVSNARVKRRKEDVPKSIVCRLSGQIMMDPVITPGGQSYERREIEKAIEENGGHDPFKVDLRYTAESLESNLCLKRYIDDYLAERPWAFGA